jgi:hypothetical protein
MFYLLRQSTFSLIVALPLLVHNCWKVISVWVVPGVVLPTGMIDISSH